MTDRAAPRPRSDRHSDATRLAFLRAAVDLLVDRGFGALTTTRVAEYAGFTRGAFQHHFASRDDLLIEVHDYVLGIDLARIPADAASLPLDQRVEVLISFLEENASSRWHAAAQALRKGIDNASPVGRAIEQRSFDMIERIHTEVIGLFPEIVMSRAEWAALIRNLAGEIFGSSFYHQWKSPELIDVEDIASRALRRRIAKLYFREISGQGSRRVVPSASGRQ